MSYSDMNQAAGIVLCGGKSSRMGLAKAWLPFGNETMLQRVVRILSDVVQPLIVVAAPGQELPRLPSDVRIARDRREGRGPLEGLLAGLEAAPAEVETVYATSCDVPLVVPAFVHRLSELLGQHDVAVPVEGPHHHPLAAVYRPRVVPVIRDLLAADRLRPVFLYERVDTLRVDVSELRGVDPQLDSLTNLNRPEDYRAALSKAGYPLPADIAARLKTMMDSDAEGICSGQPDS